MDAGAWFKKARWVAVLCALGLIPTVWAHHAPSNFDQTKHYIFRGKVNKLAWQNPHVWLYVDVQKKDGTTELWGFEAAGSNMLARAGWKADDFKAGDNVVVYGARERGDKRNAIMDKVVLANGRELTGNPLPDSQQGPPSGVAALAGTLSSGAQSQPAPIEYQ